MDGKASEKLRAILMMAQSGNRAPAMALEVVSAELEVLIPQIEALEQAQPQDAVSPLDEFRRRREELRVEMQRGVKDLRAGLSSLFQDAADALRGDE